MRLSLAALCCAAVSLPAAAQTIYKCVDPTGATLISNTRVDKSCRPIVSGPETSVPAPPRARSGTAAATPTPAGFPRVADDTQKARDGDRRHILEQELHGEQRQLDEARKALAEQEAQRGAPAERLLPYRERVGQHERNIQALQKELGGLR